MFVFNSKSIPFKLEKFKEISKVDKTPGFYMENKTETQDVDCGGSPEMSTIQVKPSVRIFKTIIL